MFSATISCHTNYILTCKLSSPQKMKSGQ